MAGTYHEPGTNTLSLTSGFLARSIHSSNGVSRKSFPSVISSVIHMCFGSLPEAVLDVFVKSSMTFSNAADQASRVLSITLTEKVLDRVAASCPAMGHVYLDGSNKRGKDVVGTQLSLGDRNGNVVLEQMDAHVGTSKKAEQAGDASICAFKNQFGVLGWGSVDGGTVDFFGKGELIHLLKNANEGTMAMSDEDKLNYLTFKSPIHHDRLFDKSKLDRTYRVLTCKVHNLKCCLAKFLEAVLGKQGLQHDASSAQMMYATAVYKGKFQELFDAITVVSVGGDVDNFTKANKVLKILYKKLAATR